MCSDLRGRRELHADSPLHAAAPTKLLEPMPGGVSANADKGYLAHTTRAGEEVVLPDIETVSTPANPFEVMVRHVPANMKRLAVEDALREIEGFKYLAMGEPHLSKRWGRMGWAVFETGTDMVKTLDALNAKLVSSMLRYLCHLA